MTTLSTTATLKIAGGIALVTICLASGCSSTPRAQFLRQRTLIHASHAGTGERLPANPVLARSKGMDIVRR